MKQPNLLELAKKGNANAIAALMNRKLQAKNITAKAALKQACLHVILESQQVPNREASIAFIRQGMLNLKPESIQKLKVYGQKRGENSSTWSEEFELITKPSLATLKQQAKQGDIEAITALLNRALEHKNITTKATFKNDCLQVILESSSLPEQQTATILVRRELLILKVNSLKTVKIYGRKRGEEFIAWNSEFELLEKVIPNSQNSLVASFNNSESDSLTKKSITASTVKTTNFDFVEQIKQALFLFNSNIGFFCLIIFSIKILPYLFYFVFLKTFLPDFISHSFIKFFEEGSLIGFFFEPLAVGAIVYATHQIKQNRQLTYKEAIFVGFRKWRLILFSRILIGFFLSFCLIGLGLIAIILFILLKNFLPLFYFFHFSSLGNYLLILLAMIMITILSLKFVFVDSIVVFEEEKEASAIIKKSECLTQGIKLNLFIPTFLFSIAWLIVRSFLTFMLNIKFSQPVIELLVILLDSIYSVVLEIFFVLCYWKVRIQKSDLYQ